MATTMDPKDLNNAGGMQAKDPGGAKKKQPGKAANTDNYGTGGPGTKAGPGKHSGTENLPEGPNGEHKAHLNTGKFGGVAGNQTPPVPPPGKEVPLVPAKGAQKAGAAKAPKLAGGAAPKKGKGAGDAKVNAAPATQVNHAPLVAFEPPTAEPAKLLDVPSVTAPEPVVIAPPAKGKIDPTFDTLRSQVSSISSLIKSSHDEILAVSKQLQQKVAGELEAYAGTIDQRVQAGTKRVGVAYDSVSKAITDAGTQATAEIAKREKSIPATIKAARDKKTGEIKNLVTNTKAEARKKIIWGPESDAARKAALAFADTVKVKHGELKTKIKQDTSPGGAIAGKLNPKQYSGSNGSGVQVPGQAARDVGLQALAEDKRLGLITDAAKQALKLFEITLKPKEEAYRTTSGIIIDESLGAADKDLDKAVAQHEPELQKNLDDAANLATQTLQKQVDTQRAGIAATQKNATTRLANDRKAAEQGAHKAGKQLADDMRSGSKEIQNKLAKKAAQDAASYSKLTKILHDLGRSKKLDEATKTKLAALKTQLDTGHGENKKTLEELATNAVAQLKSGKEQQYEQAIEGHEAAATKTKTELVGTMTGATTDLGKSFDTIGTSFDATVATHTKKLDVELKFYTDQAPKVPGEYATQLGTQLTNVVKNLSTTADKMLEPMKFQEKLDKESEAPIKEAMKTGPTDAQTLWAAMDGCGTEENTIYGVLRKASPGQIIFIEGCYNHAYPKRGTDKYNSPLRADLDDELSGTEWDIAFNYLKHEREKALTQELENSTHWYNDEEERIEEVLRSASDEEMQAIMQSPSGQAAVNECKKHLADCDLHVVEALTNTDIPMAERKLQADAIRVYDAMYGGLTGAGTDESKIKEKLAACKTQAERQALHDAYNAYIRKVDPLKVAELERQAGAGADLMDASFDDEMEGGEWTTVRTLSETKLDDKEHDATVKMAKLVEGAQGAATDEDKMFESLEDEDYAKEYADAKTDAERADVAKKHEDKLNARLASINAAGNMTKRFKGEGVMDIIKGEMGTSDITFEELKLKRWSLDAKHGDKRGMPIDGETIKRAQSLARMGALNLEQMVAYRVLQAGKAEPELMIAYACWGVSGTDETTLKKALKKGGELLTQNEVFILREKFFAVWGVDIMEGSNEILLQNFKQPTGTVPSEVDGKDWLEIRIALMGKPETPAQIAYVDNVRYRFVTTGTGSPSPFSHAREDMEVNHQELQAKAAEHINDKDLKAFDAKKPPELTEEQKKAYGTKTTADSISSAAHLEENGLEILAGYAEASEMAFLDAKEAMINAVITVVELIGLALITAASMGANSPMLVMFIGNLILSGMTIAMRKEAMGDAFGNEELGIEAVKAIVMAAIQAGGEAKFITNFAGRAGKLGGKAWEIFASGAEKGGLKVAEGEALALTEKAALKMQGEVLKAAEATAGKTVAKETAEVGAKEAAQVGTKEAAEVGTKEAAEIGTKEAAEVGTKEAAEIGTKEAAEAGTKEAAEKGAAKETAQAAVSEEAKKAAAKQRVESFTKEGFKNATTTAISETAQFLMDEKTYEMKFWEALFDNPQSIGRRLLRSVPSAFAQGAVSDYISNISGSSTPHPRGKIRSGTEAMFRQILSDVAGNTAGFFVCLDNYQDAGTFWIEFFKSNANSIASGGFNGVFGHAMRAKQLAREFVNAHKGDGDIPDALGKLHEAIGYMKPEEMSSLANHVATMDPKYVDMLPPEFKKYVGKQQPAAPANDNADGKGTHADKKSTIAPTEDEKKAAKPPTTSDEDKKAKPGDKDADTKVVSKDVSLPAGSTLEHGAGRQATTRNLEHETTNLPQLTARAHSALESLKPHEQVAVRQTLAAAENAGHTVMLERALAAGRQPHELEALRVGMRGMTADEVATRFTGAGVVQFYQQSCVPTAYQIAIADIDPYYAFDLRNHSEKVMQAQRDVLIDAKSAQTKRNDLAANAPDNKQIADHAAEKNGMAEVLANPDNYSKPGEYSQNGMAPTKMEGTGLHKQLEAATGHKYEVLVNQLYTEGGAYKGPDSFAGGQEPHARIMATLDQRLPVIISRVNDIDTSAGHAMVLIGYERDARGNVFYFARDPQTGHVVKKTQSQLGDLPTVALPADVHAKPADQAPDGKHTTAKVGAGGEPTGSAVTPAAPEPRREFQHDLKPGDVPPNLTEAQQKAFAEANQAYDRLKKSAFNGEEFARKQWAKLLNEAGVNIHVPAPVTHVGERAQAETVEKPAAPEAQHKAEGAISAKLGSRASTDATLATAVAAKAFDEIAHNPIGFKVLERRGNKVEVEIAGTKPPLKHTIHLVVPDHMEAGQVAGFARDTKDLNQTLVWLSNSVPNDQAVRALNGVIAQAVAQRKMEAHQSTATPKQAGEFGQLGGMLEHLEVVKKQETKPVSLVGMTKAERLKNAQDNASNESPARLHAEIDLMLHDMGIAHPGEARDRALSDMEKMDPRLAAAVRKHLETQQVGIRVNPDGVVRDPAEIAKPKHAENDRLPTSDVLGALPTEVKPYTAADQKHVLELRVVFEQIKEIDTRLKQRDQKGTSDKDVTVAKGETMRRRELVDQAKALMEHLQLGGADPKYYKDRLDELERVFPGVKDYVAPMVMDRVNKRAEANDVHLKAAAFAEQAKLHAEQHIKASVMKEGLFTTDRVVIGDGVAGLADIATLGYKPGADGFIDPTHCLVLGGADLVARMADADASMRWGQRAELFDPANGGGHAVFRGEDGKTDGNLRKRTEDGGEFVSVGELRDAMDLARQRMGVARLPARVEKVELQSKNKDTWHPDAGSYEVRLTIIVGDQKKVIYAHHADVTTGIGQAQLPDPSILNEKDRNTMFANKTLVSGEDIMTMKDRSALEGKKVLVIGYGPTGGWAAVEAQRRGGERASVDWAGGSGQPADHEKSNKSGHAGLSAIDRVAEALDPASKVNITTDRIFSIKSQGAGAEVTYLKADGSTYTVKYDVVVSAIGPDNTNSPDKPTTQSENPSAGAMLDGIDMRAQKGTNSPTLESSEGGDKNGAVRVIGAAAAEGVGLKDKNEKEKMKERREALAAKNSADSPDHRVFEYVGEAAEMANATGKTAHQRMVDDQVKDLRRLQHDMDHGATDADKARAKQEYERRMGDEAWQNAFHLVDPFFAAKVQQGKDKQGRGNDLNPDEIKRMSSNVGGFLAAADEAKVGRDPRLQAKRDQFERAVALAILKDGPIRAQVDAQLEVMCQKALDYIERTRSGAERDAAYAKLSTSKEKGYGGGLGTGNADHDVDMVKTVLASGNIRERMLALQQFQQLVGEDVLSPQGRLKLQKLATFGHDDSSRAFTPEDANAILDRYMDYAKETVGKETDRSVKKFYEPLKGEVRGPDATQGDYADAKAQNMDTKLPQLVLEKVEQHLRRKLAESGALKDGTALVGKGEESPLARTTISVRDAIRDGLNLSQREIDAAGGLDAPLNWVVGSRANIVDPNATFIKDAKDKSMPLKAGVSGTTYRWMRLVEMMGGDANLGRLAAIASLQAADAHSFHEIAFAAKGFGLAYSVDNPYANMGIPQAELERIAKSLGTTLDELNGKPPSGTP